MLVDFLGTTPVVSSHRESSQSVHLLVRVFTGLICVNWGAVLKSVAAFRLFVLAFFSLNIDYDGKPRSVN